MLCFWLMLEKVFVLMKNTSRFHKSLWFDRIAVVKISAGLSTGGGPRFSRGGSLL